MLAYAATAAVYTLAPLPLVLADATAAAVFAPAPPPQVLADAVAAAVFAPAPPPLVLAEATAPLLCLYTPLPCPLPEPRLDPTHWLGALHPFLVSPCPLSPSPSLWDFCLFTPFAGAAFFVNFSCSLESSTRAGLCVLMEASID